MTIPDVSGADISDYDRVQPTGKWQFDEDVTKVFDNMLERSIPQYPVMRESVLQLISQFCTDRIDVLDLGASAGTTSEMLLNRFDHGTIHGVEVSIPMINYARTRLWQIDPQEQRATFERLDLRTEFPTLLTQPNVILSILTLQFIPIEYRERIVRSVYEALEPGGVFILVEKVLGRTATIDDAMVDIYLHQKRENGYTDEQIDRKRTSLEGVLVPITARWNEELLLDAGFATVDCFWRWMNFAGWIAIKTP
jgi:tRNA (cmo5U34)-methyltransferase